MTGEFLDLKKLPIAWLDANDLSKTVEFDCFARKIRHAKTQMEEKTKRPLRLVILDTLNAAFNFDEDADAAVTTRHLKKLSMLGIELDLLILVVHHAGKNIEAGETGSHAHRTSVEESILVYGKKDNTTGLWSDRRVTAIKVRDGSKEGWSCSFDLEKVALGYDSDNDEKSSMIAVPVEVEGANDNTVPVENNTRATRPINKFMAALDLVYEHTAQKVEIDGKVVRACLKTDVQAEFFNKNGGGATKRETAARYFREGARGAKDDGLMFESGKYVWPFFDLRLPDTMTH